MFDIYTVSAKKCFKHFQTKTSYTESGMAMNGDVSDAFPGTKMKRSLENIGFSCVCVLISMDFPSLPKTSKKNSREFPLGP